MSWALHIYCCIVTDGRLCFPDENLVSTLTPKRADAASSTIPLSCEGGSDMSCKQIVMALSVGQKVLKITFALKLKGGGR